MRRRRSHTMPDYDALTDVLACSVGVMIMLLLVAAILARDVSVKVVFPRATPSTKRLRQFICVDGTVRPYEVEPLHRRLLAPLAALAVEPTTERLYEITRQMDGRTVTNEFWQLRASMDADVLDYGFFQYGGVTNLFVFLEPVAGAEGDDAEAVAAPGSAYRRWIGELDPTREYVHFMVDAASIEVFRAAREVAVEAGLHAGWRPIPSVAWPMRLDLLASYSPSAAWDLTDRPQG